MIGRLNEVGVKMDIGTIMASAAVGALASCAVNYFMEKYKYSLRYRDKLFERRLEAFLELSRLLDLLFDIEPTEEISINNNKKTKKIFRGYELLLTKEGREIYQNQENKVFRNRIWYSKKLSDCYIRLHNAVLEYILRIENYPKKMEAIKEGSGLIENIENVVKETRTALFKDIKNGYDVDDILGNKQN